MNIMLITRNDLNALAGFDQNDYVANFDANTRDFDELLEELKTIQQSSIYLFHSLDNNELLRIGTASGNQMLVRALGYIISGHLLHHLKVIKERYL